MICQICKTEQTETARQESERLFKILLSCKHANLYPKAKCPDCASTRVSISTAGFIFCNDCDNQEEKPTESKYRLLRSRKNERLDFIQGVECKVPFQSESCEFIDKAFEQDYQGAGIFHEMGLGKMIIACAWLACNKETALPAAIFCKSGLKWQWFYKLQDWIRKPVQVLIGSKDCPEPEIADIYVISLDSTINRKKRRKNQDDEVEIHENKIYEQLLALGVKTVILDECQSIKNPESKRSSAFTKFLKHQIEVVPTVVKDDTRPALKTELEAMLAQYNLQDRFKLIIETLPGKILGLCRVDVQNIVDGNITGSIELSSRHFHEDPEEDVLDTMLHEIAHALTPGAGHSDVWKETAASIGADPKATGNCTGTVDPKFMTSVPIKFIPLSGTPIKNYPHEFYPVLNRLNPDMFYSYAMYLRNECDYSSGFGGKTVCRGLVNPEAFHNKTAPFILRYTRDEVAPNLPRPMRNPLIVEIDNKQIEAEYEAQLAEFTKEAESGGTGSTNFTNLLAYLARMRHLTGLAKIKPCIDFVADFLIETDRPITIFAHHQDVEEILIAKLTQLCKDGGFNPPIYYTAQSSAKEIEQLQKNCADYSWVSPDPKKDRIFIGSTLSAGEGLNMQACSDCIILERQWNPANEEQAESRFIRMGSKANFVSATYITALGTIDEFFSELVEKKRAIVKQVLDGEETKWDESSIMKELIEVMADKGLNKWKMR